MNNRLRASYCAGALVLALLAAGCVDQRKEVAIYQKELNKLPGATQPVTIDYTPLTLAQAMRLAEQNDEDIATAGETYLQALYTQQKDTAALLPQVSLGPSLSFNQKVRGGKDHTLSVPINGSEDLLDVKQAATISEDAANVEQDRQKLLDMQQTVLQKVVTDYYQVLIDERQVLVFQSSLDEQEELVRQSEAKYRLGSGKPLDVAQSQSQASQTRVQLIQFKTSVQTDRAALAQVIGSQTTDRTLTDGFQPPEEDLGPVEIWLSDAGNLRQDLLAAAAAVEAARDGVRVAIAEYYPSISLNLQYLFYIEPNSQTRLTGTLTADLPIFKSGSIEADVLAAFSTLRSDVLSQRKTRKQVEDDVRMAYANLQSSRDQIKELRVELAANRGALVLAQAQYNVGLAINLDVLTAVFNLLQTQLQLAEQVYDEKIDYLNLLRVSGQLNLDAAAPTARSANEMNDLQETTTPDVVRSITRPY